MSTGFVVTPLTIGLSVRRKISVARFTSAFAILLALCLCAVRLHAQATASIVGTVHDSSGAIVPGVNVTATNRNTGYSRSSMTNDDGDYVINPLPIGVYTRTAAHEGFKQVQIPDFTLQVEQQARIGITLPAGSFSEVVNVTDVAPLIQTDTSSVGQVINNKQIIDLPLNSRHTVQLIALTPGALTSPVVGTTNSSNGGPIPSSDNGPGLVEASVSGGGLKTEFLLDGITNSEQLYDGIQFEPSVDFIPEFKVLSNDAPAQYGRGSAVVVMGTKSGTNQLHGTGFEFIRPILPKQNFGLASSQAV
jgi:hypothetical protein